MLETAVRIIGIVTPSFLLAAVGLLWARFGPEYQTRFVTTLVLNLAMPALVFHTLVTSDIPRLLVQQIGLATVAVHVILMLLFVLLLRFTNKDPALSVAHTIGNTGNLGLPLCLYAFGQQGLAYAIVFFSIQCVFLFTVGDAVYAGSVSLKRLLRVPIVHAVIAAMLVRGFQVPIPAVLLESTRLLGQPVVPIMLITLGVSIAGMKIQNLRRDVGWSLLRTLVAALVGFLVAELFALEGVARGVLIIETVVPVAVFNYLLAVRHNRDSAEVSGLILVTHLLALLYIPAILVLVL